MKTNQFLPLMAALLVAPSALLAQNTATTTPVGYVTQEIPANGFSFLGLTVHSPTISSGTLSAATTNSVEHAGVNFQTLLTAGATYILELENGTIQEITSWDSTGKLNTPQNISAQVNAGVTKYTLRKAKTISEIFGAQNTFGLKPTDGNIRNADQIFLVAPSGQTIVYYYDDGSEAGWFTSGGDDASNLPIVYTDGFYVRRQPGSQINLVTSGEVKMRPSSTVLVPGWNYQSSVSPAGLTLGNSGINQFLTASEDGGFRNVDNVYIPTSSGFTIAYYYDDGTEDTGWYTTQGNRADSLPLEGGFLVLSRSSTTKPFTIAAPPVSTPQ